MARIRGGVICPGGVKTEFAIGRGRTEDGVAQSITLETSDVANALAAVAVRVHDPKCHVH